MTRAISGERLERAVRDHTFIKSGDPLSVEGVKYDFHIGPRVLKASVGQPIEILNIPEPQRVIEPGEIVFVLSEERLELPSTILAELSPKRKLSHEGILVLGGFCVDPLYQGRLLIGLYNFSSTQWPLRGGKKLIAAVFFELDDQEVSHRKDEKVPEGIEDFPDELVRMIRNYKPIVLQGLQDNIIDLRRQISDLNTRITSDREWQRQFQTSLDRHDQQIDRLLRTLEEEQVNRKVGEKEFKDQLAAIQKQMWKMAATLTAIIGGVVIALSAIAQLVLPGLIKYLRG